VPLKVQVYRPIVSAIGPIQPVSAKKSISLPFTTRLPSPEFWPKVKALAEKVRTLSGCWYHLPLRSDGTGPPTGQPDGLGDAVAETLAEGVEVADEAAGT
jgi:hypothetical protein